MPKPSLSKSSLIIVAVAFGGAGTLSQADAAAVSFIGDKAGFDAAIAGIPDIQQNVRTFDDVPGGTTIPSGTTFQGITPTYEITFGSDSFDLIVRDDQGGVSGQNNLALSDDGTSFDRFALGDAVDFVFATPTNSFGMFVIVSGAAFDFVEEDVNLTFAGLTASTSGDETASVVGSSGVAALFIGIVDPDAVFSSASLRFGPEGDSGQPLFEIDDVSTTELTAPAPAVVPVPAALPLFGSALLGLAALSRRRRGQQGIRRPQRPALNPSATPSSIAGW